MDKQITETSLSKDLTKTAPSTISNPQSPCLSEKKPEMDSSPVKKIHVKNLHRKINNDELREFFGQFGEIVYSHIVINPKTMKSRRYGFIEFKDQESVQK